MTFRPGSFSLSTQTLFAIGKVRGFYDVTTFLNEPVAKYVDYWPLNTWEVFAIFYTSGCSDVPKGVHISHRAYVYAFYAFEYAPTFYRRSLVRCSCHCELEIELRAFNSSNCEDVAKLET